MKTYVYDPKSEFEIARIAEREKNTRRQRAIALENRHFNNINRILDVGCGTGVVGFDLLNRIPTIRLMVGLDIEPSILNVAKNNLPSLKQIDFITGDAFQLPLKTGGVDLVSCQYVLQHLAHPERILNEMRRVTRPGGYAIIFEFDDLSEITYPPKPPELDLLFKAKIDLIEKRGGDRSIGRKLYHLLKLAGWSEVEIKIIPDIWIGPADRNNALSSAYMSFTQIKSQLIEEKLISENVFETALKQLYGYYQGDLLSIIFFFSAFARNPGKFETITIKNLNLG